jgi:plasmid stabilization system protein ParE
VIVFAEDALADLERIFEFDFDHDPARALEGIARIRSAVLVLDEHPEIGRPVGAGSTLRELVISRGKTGYIALYEYAAANHVVRVVAVRHQREAGYRG